MKKKSKRELEKELEIKKKFAKALVELGKKSGVKLVSVKIK